MGEKKKMSGRREKNNKIMGEIVVSKEEGTGGVIKYGTR